MGQRWWRRKYRYVTEAAATRHVWQKVAKFIYPTCIRRSLHSPSEFRIYHHHQFISTRKTRMIWLPLCWGKHDDVLSRLDTIPKRDRHTDKRTDGRTELLLYQYRASALLGWRAIKMKRGRFYSNVTSSRWIVDVVCHVMQSKSRVSVLTKHLLARSKSLPPLPPQSRPYSALQQWNRFYAGLSRRVRGVRR